MNTVPREEMIDCESYYRMVDYHYERGMTDLPTGIVHCDMGSIPEFFREISGNDEKYVVVSSRSDFGLHYQQQFPPFFDYSKFAAQAINYQNSFGGYKDIVLPAPINKEKCVPFHKYSIKCYRHTEATFNTIPGNVVKWFVTNNTIYDDDRIVNLPFGINGVDGDKTAGDKIYNKVNNSIRPDNCKMYINFAFYTAERIKLFLLYKDEAFGDVEQGVDFDTYLDKLISHNCVLCPSGNGWDTYRVLEALYMDCIPIVEMNHGMCFYRALNLPIIFTNSLEAVTVPVLHGIRNSKHNDRTTWDLSKITVSYWRNQIEECRTLL
jgi:hypothetical protein